jgi:hypothetical protein
METNKNKGFNKRPLRENVRTSYLKRFRRQYIFYIL